MSILYYERSSIYHSGISVIQHHGIKGQKWGVRRTKEELKYNPASVRASVNHLKIKVKLAYGEVTCQMGVHPGDRVAERCVSAKDVVDTLKFPLHTKSVKLDEFGRPSQQMIGKHATVCVNPETGIITSLWPTSSRLCRKYSKGG